MEMKDKGLFSTTDVLLLLLLLIVAVWIKGSHPDWYYIGPCLTVAFLIGRLLK